MLSQSAEFKIHSLVNALMVHAFDAPFKYGLADGLLGMALVLHHYGHAYVVADATEFANYLLDYVIVHVSDFSWLDFQTGLTGLGWGIEYLSQNHFVCCDSADICEEIDQMIKSTDIVTLHRNGDAHVLQDVMRYLSVHFASLKGMAITSMKDYLWQQADYMQKTPDCLNDANCQSWMRGLAHLEDCNRNPPSLSPFVQVKNQPNGYGLRIGLAGLIENMIDNDSSQSP